MQIEMLEQVPKRQREQAVVRFHLGHLPVCESYLALKPDGL